GFGVESDDVAVHHSGQWSADGGLGAEVDGGRDLAGGPGHAAVRYEGDAMTPVHEHPEGRDESVEFGHSLGLGAVVADHHDGVTIEFARPEGTGEVRLGGEDPRGGLDDSVLGCDGRHLDDGTAEVAGHHAESAFGSE